MQGSDRPPSVRTYFINFMIDNKRKGIGIASELIERDSSIKLHANVSIG